MHAVMFLTLTLSFVPRVSQAQVENDIFLDPLGKTGSAHKTFSKASWDCSPKNTTSVPRPLLPHPGATCLQSSAKPQTRHRAG